MRHRDRIHVLQLALFRPASPNPDWSQLPADTRERVLRLITRLLRERRKERVHALAAGGRDDE
jgi:acyl-CoA reductase-like NAD-dependent aldehyde dehydrogenase